MRTALYAGLVAGALSLPILTAYAAEGSSLRGLIPPRDVAESAALSPEASREPGLTWRGIETRQEFSPRLSLYGGTLDVRRFSSGTAEVSTSLYRPLGPSLMLAPGTLDPLHDTLPKYTLYRHLNQALPGGWGIGFGTRQSAYNFGMSTLVSMSAERYMGNFRGAYTLYSSRIEGSDLGAAHRWQVNYFYGERNTVGFAYTTGRDIDSFGAPPGLTLNDAKDFTLSGRHWLSPNWALTYDLLSHEQGSLYKRQGLRLGVSRSF